MGWDVAANIGAAGGFHDHELVTDNDAMIEQWLVAGALLRPVLAACALPPVPFLVLACLGAWQVRARSRVGLVLVALACAGIWLAGCNGMATWLEHALLPEPPALTAADRAALKASAAGGRPMAIVVLGGGLDREAPEYGGPGPSAAALERLRYGAWLSRSTDIPLAVSGGTGWAGPQDEGSGAARVPAEADIMAGIAAEDFGRPLRWRETASRDTRENAGYTVALLAPQGVREIVVVTHGWHMPRALRDFRAAAAADASASVPAMAIRPAPMGLAPPSERPLLDWMPSGTGAMRVRVVLREALASLFDR
jgi:uncharacterized SAM-binding protein YcdF (DUF218 family)